MNRARRGRWGTLLPVDAILFSANPNMVTVDDAIRHLADHKELYWAVPFRIVKDNFSYPLYGFMHISGGQVEYRVTVCDIVSFSPAHYEGELAARVKPQPWLQKWRKNANDTRSRSWKNALVMTDIVPVSYDTCSFKKADGAQVQAPPRSYVRVLPPDQIPQLQALWRRTPSKHLAERNLEDFVVQRLQEIEPGLRLVSRQLSTLAGRLDLLCMDASGCYVVVELKRMQGTDQVVGQILRYMGWVREFYHTEKVRGIIIVGKKDPTLKYAVMAAPNVQAKEFKLLID
ncbi:MAG: endonuclease NucS domain-containing protein [Candidatus Sulfotelmatobacter sp.]